MKQSNSQSRRSIYILLPITILIWSFLAYKIFFFSTESEQFKETKTIKDEKAVILIDSTPLNLDYQDPFLHDEILTETIFEEEKVKQVNIPPISFFGFVQNTQNQKLIALIEMKGEKLSAEQGNSIGRIRICKIYKDSLDVEMDGNHYTILKAQ